MESQPGAERLSVVHVNGSRTWRGGERQTLLLARGLAHHGVVSYIAAPPDGVLYKEAQASGMAAIPVRIGSGLDFAAALRLRAAVTGWRIEIVHAHTAHAHAVSALALAGLRTPALVVTRRVDRHISPNFFSRLKYRRCDRIIAISDKVRGNLLADGIPAHKIVRIYSGIDTAAFSGAADLPALDDKLGVPRDAVVVGTIAALTREKDHATLLRAAGKVLKSAPATCFVLIGDGPEKGALQKQARALGIERNVVFAGERLDAEQLPTAFDIFVLPSRSEGLGSSVLDAMAAGVPVIASSTGGIPEMVEDGASGLLFEPGDADGLAQHILSLSDSSRLRDSLAAEGRKRVEAFDIRHGVAETAKLYRSLHLQRTRQ